MYICVFIYIYMYIYVYTYIYIYTYRIVFSNFEELFLESSTKYL